MKKFWNTWAVRILFPVVLTTLLFIVSLFIIVIPSTRTALLDRARARCQSQTQVAISTLNHYYTMELMGDLTREEAQKQAAAAIRDIRYGAEMKDYFWINDMHPTMVMHPYVTELDGQDLTGFTDPKGKHLFVEFVKVVEQNGFGYVDYMWQWKDDATRIVPKVSYVEGFEPWGWVIGTGIYIEDERAELARLTNKLVITSLVIVIIISLLLLNVLVHSRSSERRRIAAEQEQLLLTNNLSAANDELKAALEEMAAVNEDLHRSQIALEASEEHFKTIFQTSPDAVIITRFDDGTCVDINEGFTEQTGYTIDEIKGRTTIDKGIWVEPGDRKRYVELIKQDGYVSNLETRFRKKDGTLTTVLFSSRLINLFGEPHMLSLARNIDKWKAAEKARLASERQYRLLAENITDIIWTMDTQGRHTFVSPSVLDILGYTQEEAIQIPLEDLLTPESCAEANTIISKLFDADSKDIEPVIVQSEMYRKDRSKVWVEVKVSPLLDDDGHPIGLLGITRDISERRQAEKLQRRLSTVIEQSAESIIITNLDKQIIYVNPTFERVSGYAAGDVLDQPVRSLELGVHGPEFHAGIWEKLEAGETWQGRITNRTKSGKYYEEEVTVSPVRNLRGEIENYVFIKRDVTQEVNLEKQLRQVQKMEAIGTLAGGIAHDFNNILFAIKGFSEMVDEQLEEAKLDRSNIQEVLTATNRASEIVRQILTFSRHAERTEAPVRILDSIKEVVKLLRASLPSSIEITQNIECDEAIVRADPTQLHQILINLCTNAGHAMGDAGGLLDVNLRSAIVDKGFSEKHIGLKEGPYVILSVSDTGHGIPVEVRERIFEPFFTTKAVGRGTGMGLSVVHGIVSNLGGTITVYSEPGKGSTFNVYLPRIFDQPEDEKTGIFFNPVGTERILVVDDEVQLAIMLKKRLERYGYTVDAWSKSALALDAFKNEPEAYDIVITDLTMPGMGGDELAREILSIRPEMPIILCTGFSQVVSRDQAFKIGVRDYVMKPLNILELGEKIRNILDTDREVRV